MPVSGSNLVNTSANGQPTDAEDRPFSYAIGTQLFINPSSTPTDAVVTFKVAPELLTGSVAATVVNLAVGYAIDSELNTLSNWTSDHVQQASSNRFAVGFGRSSATPEKVNVNVQGQVYTTLPRNQSPSVVDVANNSLTITSHPYTTGDRVVITSTGTIPGGLSSTSSYYVIVENSNSIKLAVTYSNADAGSDIDIQTTGSGTITVVSDEIFTLTRAGSSGSVTLLKGSVLIATFSNTNVDSPLRLFYWCREQSASSTDPVLKEIKVRGAI